MKLRSNQALAIDRAIDALRAKGNTLLVAPTGFGKTITMAGLTTAAFKEFGLTKAMTMQHREELLTQNLEKFKTFTGGRISTSRFCADTKSMRGRSVFATVQTLSKNLDRIGHFGLCNIDEAHHAVCSTYLDPLDKMKEQNPDLKSFLVTATPIRGDKKKLSSLVDNVCDVIEIGDLIASGHLVPPVTYKPTIGGLREEVNSVHQGKAEFDMDEAASVLNKSVITAEVIRKWEAIAGDRKTIVFCANQEHAKSVARAWSDAGYKTGLVHSNMPKGSAEDPAEGTRRRVLQDYEQGKIQVLVNVMVLTEGFDDQPTSCVVILRPAAHRSTFIQIVGRGLRKVDVALYPGVVKRDCIVLDFCSKHDGLEVDVREMFIEEKKLKGPVRTKVCPDCLSEIPQSSRECAICGHEFPYDPPADRETVDSVRMIEIDLLKRSKMGWIDLFDNQRAMMANGFMAYALAVQADPKTDTWVALGASKTKDGLCSDPIVLEVGGRVQCLAGAQDWMGTNETNQKAGKSKSWVGMPMSSGQSRYFSKFADRFPGVGDQTQYAASCRIDYMLNERKIVHAVNDFLMY